jgi:signal transduction histidine kinase
LEIILSLTLSGVLAMSLIYFLVHNLTEPLKNLSAVAASLKTVKSEDFDLWLENLKRFDPRGQAEVAVIQEVLQRLGTAVPRLGYRLIAGERQACLGRVLARNLPVFESWSTRLQVLGGEGGPPLQALPEPARQEMREILRNMQLALQDVELFLPEGEIKWHNFDPAPALQSAWRLVTLGLPPDVKLTREIGPLPSIWGSPGELAQALLHIGDFLAGHLGPAGDLSLQARTTASGSLEIMVHSSGPVFSQSQCQQWLDSFQNIQEIQENLGPALAGAIASRHGGSLTLSPRAKGGLTFCLVLPGAGGDA